MAYHIPPEITDRISDYVAAVEHDVPVSAVYVFGSHAKGTARPTSDIDIAVISPAFGKDEMAENRLLRRALLRVPYKYFDTIGYSPEYFRTGFSPLLDQIRKTGIRVA
jgi:predicted nucleotidyltransferase